jgi:hypothetical protein
VKSYEWGGRAWRRAGWQRLHRFKIAMGSPTIQAPADHLGADQATLVRQLHRLETDIGAQLYHRAAHADPTIDEPQRPTPPRLPRLLKALNRADVRALLDRATP